MDESVPFPAAEYIAAIAAPLLTALVTALGVRLRQRLQNRDERHRVRNRVHEATAEVAFIRAWCEAVQHADADGTADLARAREDLQEIYDEVFTDGTAGLRTADRPAGWTLDRAVNTVVLLRVRAGPEEGARAGTYRRPLGAARVVRPLYWFALVWTFFIGLAMAAANFGDNASGGALAGLGLTLLLSVVLGVLPAAAVRELVLFLDDRALAQRAAGPAPEPPRQPAPRDLSQAPA